MSEEILRTIERINTVADELKTIMKQHPLEEIIHKHDNEKTSVTEIVLAETSKKEQALEVLLKVLRNEAKQCSWWNVKLKNAILATTTQGFKVRADTLHYNATILLKTP